MSGTDTQNERGMREGGSSSAMFGRYGDSSNSRTQALESVRERGLEASSSSSVDDGLFPRLQIDSLEERDRPAQGLSSRLGNQDRPLGGSRFGPANSRRAFMQQRELIDMLREVY